MFNLWTATSGSITDISSTLYAKTSSNYFNNLTSSFFSLGSRTDPTSSVLFGRLSAKQISIGASTGSGRYSPTPIIAITSSDDAASSLMAIHFLFLLGNRLDGSLNVGACIWGLSTADLSVSTWPFTNSAALPSSAIFGCSDFSPFHDDGFRVVREHSLAAYRSPYRDPIFPPSHSNFIGIRWVTIIALICVIALFLRTFI